MTTLHLETDGGARGNPGPAGIGVVIRDDRGATVETISRFIGTATNNEAEYRALIAGLEAARRLGAGAVTVRSDSELMVRQMLGQYRVKDPGLRKLHAEAMAAARAFGHFSISHVRREHNRQADKLVNEGIDSALNGGGAQK